LTAASRTVLRQLVRIVSAIIFAIAEEPLWNAAVISASRTALPTSGAVALPALISRLVRIITAVIVEIAHPQFWNAATILALELGINVALTIIWNKKNEFYLIFNAMMLIFLHFSWRIRFLFHI